MRVIALTGRAGSGKDTAALMLQILTGAVGTLSNGDGTFTRNPFGGEIDLNAVIPFYQRVHPFYVLNDEGKFAVHKFAWPVYQIAAVLLGVEDPTELMNSKFKEQVVKWGLTGRQLLQKIGTECFRDVIGEQIWCDVLDNHIEKAGHKNVIVSDCRFINEGQYLENEYDAFIIRLAGRDSGVDTTHQSEAELSKIPAAVAIPNEGSYADLMNQLSNVCSYLGILNCKYTWK